MNIGRFTITLLGFAALVALILVDAITSISVAYAENVYVQVRSAALRTAPEQFSPKIQALNYGENLDVLDRNGGWIKVSTEKGSTGFVHNSAVTKKQIILSDRPGLKEVNAEASEVVLAGKGLNEIFESSYSTSVSAEKYKLVDQIERYELSMVEFEKFLREGGLK